MTNLKWEDNPNRHERRRRLRSIRMDRKDPHTRGAFGTPNACPRYFKNKKFTYKINK
jgi:hypothetical protein